MVSKVYESFSEDTASEYHRPSVGCHIQKRPDNVEPFCGVGRTTTILFYLTTLYY